MSKKSALDLACEKTGLYYREVGCSKCPVFKDDFCCGNFGAYTCEQALKQHFQQQADIPDGGDVIFKIRNYLLYPDKFDYENANVLYKQINKGIEEYGIEVDYETN